MGFFVFLAIVAALISIGWFASISIEITDNRVKSDPEVPLHLKKFAQKVYTLHTARLCTLVFGGVITLTFVLAALFA